MSDLAVILFAIFVWWILRQEKKRKNKQSYHIKDSNESFIFYINKLEVEQNNMYYFMK